jgi:glycosyltransferase involved in cell wall biosynthesis
MHICLSFGKLRGRYNGLGEFALQLSSQIAAKAHPDVKLTVHADEVFAQWLHPRFQFQKQSWINRIGLGGPSDVTVWHTLSQFFKMPPPKSAQRLVTIHDLNYKYFARPASQERGRKRILRAIRQHNHLASISTFSAQDISETFQLDQEVNVVLNGATSLVGLETCKPKGVLPQPLLFHVSRMSVSKNTACILDLIRAWPEMNFVLAGRMHSDTKGIHDILVSEGLSNAQVLFDIEESEKAWLYQHCAGFLFPSLTEGFGLPPIEAMYFGKPTFLSRLTSLPEVGGDQAHYLEDFDPASVRAVIEPAIEPSAAEARSCDVVAHAGSFTWARCAREYLEIYAEMAGVSREEVVGRP